MHERAGPVCVAGPHETDEHGTSYAVWMRAPRTTNSEWPKIAGHGASGKAGRETRDNRTWNAEKRDSTTRKGLICETFMAFDI